MRDYTMAERAELYEQAEPGKKWPASVPWVGPDGRIYGMWILGQDYRNRSPLYGAYPPNYVMRVEALFPDRDRVLHLFSGSLPVGSYTRFDIREDAECDVRGDAHQLSTHFRPGEFDFVMADPPYSCSDADRYGTPWIQRNKVVKEVCKVLRPGGFLVWLDQVLPMYRKDTLNLQGVIGLVRSTNHRFRVVTIFERVGTPELQDPAMEGFVVK